jgi:ribosomal peptide maturation radical SAM protein 1
LAVESSRGCWWGRKSHCTFCGLNGGTMAFRSKSAPRFAAELETLSRKHETTHFAVTDNILDMSYLRSLFPELVKQARRYHLFYETKSNLRKEQVELLAAAGVSVLQPGIESFSTDILKLMAKGTSRLQNIQLLKWCYELGVRVTWNLLYGFPGEDPHEYQEMADLLPSLFHLSPPSGCSKVRLDRFGPYWKSPETYGLHNLRPYWSYDFALAGVPPAERARLAYFFEYEYGDGSNPYDYARPTAERVAEWRRAATGTQRVKLELHRSGSGPRVVDTRPCSREEVHPLTAPELALLHALDGFRSRNSLGDAVRAQGIDVDDAACEALADELLARHFLVEEHGILLSLVVDPRERERVAERQVTLRLDRLGLRWPEDFPDPQNQEVVRAAMLAMAPVPAITTSAS